MNLWLLSLIYNVSYLFTGRNKFFQQNVAFIGHVDDVSVITTLDTVCSVPNTKQISSIHDTVELFICTLYSICACFNPSSTKESLSSGPLLS